MSATATDVFLSYSRADTPAVRQIQAYLKQAGFATFLDRDQLPAGQPWLPALEQAITRCAAVAILVGPAGLGTWQQKLRRMFAEVLLVYTSPVETPSQLVAGSGTTANQHQIRQQRKPLLRQTDGFSPVFGNRYAV